MSEIGHYMEAVSRLKAERDALVTEAEQLRGALEAYDALFHAWEGRDSLMLNEEALRQWRSIAQEALAPGAAE